MSTKNDSITPQFSRRQFLFLTGTGLAAGVLGLRPLVSTTQAATVLPREEAQGTQTLVAAWPTSPNGLDHEFHNSVATLSIQRNCGVAPLKYGPKPNGQVFECDFGKLLPDAAKEWKLSPDSKSITLTLNEGVMSSVGNELTADDFVYKFQRSFALKGMKNGLIKMAMLLSDPNNVKKEGKYTFTIYSDAPNVLLEAMQSHEASVIFDSVEYKKHATDDDQWSTKWAANNWVSFGPYKLTDYKPGQQWVLERNENYFNPSEVTSNLAKIIYKEIPSSANRVALLESGDIDMAWDLGAAELKKMETTPDVRVDNLAGTYLQWFGFTFGSEQTPQLGDSNVRFAIQYALPYDELLARPYLGLAKQMRCTVAPIYPGWDVVSKVWDRQQSLDKAKEYMAKSQYPTGFKTTIHFDINAVGQEESAIIIKSALAEIGIDAEIVKVQTADFFNLAFGGQGFPGLFIFRDMCGIPDVNFGTHLYIKTGHCCAPGKYSNKDVDALYDQAQRTIGNLDKRIELQRQIEDIAWNKDPMGAPMATLGFQMASRDNVTGWWWHNLQEIKWAHTAKA